MPKGSNTPEPTIPWPPRFWWLKRIALGWLFVIALLLIVRLIWGWQIDRRMENQLAAWRALGQPTRPEDFAEPEVPDAENAALVLMGLRVSNPIPWEWEDELKLPLPPGMVKGIQRRVKLNAKVLDAVRRARGMPKVRWGYAISAGADGQWHSPRIGVDSEVADLIHAAALEAHQQGDDARAMEYVLDLLSIAKADRVQPSIMHAVGLADRTAQWVIAEIAPDFNVGAIKASPETSREALTALLDEDGRTNAIIRGLMVERCRMPGIYRHRGDFVANGPVPGRPWHIVMAWLLQPATDKLAFCEMRMVTLAAEQIAAGRPASARSTANTDDCKPDDHPLGSSQRLCNVSRSNYGWLPFMNTLPNRCLMRQADVRATALSLAIRLYQLDHNGRYPATLDELAPKYLPAVPDDPFSGKPFRYEPAADPPFLLSVGKNGVDDLAAGTWRPKDWSTHINWSGVPDAIYPLTRQPRPSGPDAVEEDGDEADDDMQPDDPAEEEENP